jgi:hypothetical protein
MPGMRQTRKWMLEAEHERGSPAGADIGVRGSRTRALRWWGKM